MNVTQQSLLIVKSIFLFLVGLNILSSVWVIIYDHLAVKQAQEQYPDDWKTKERGEGSYAKYWFISCVIIMAINFLLCLSGIFGAIQESSQIIMIYSALSFVMAVYGALDKYMKGSISSYLVPLISGIIGILFASIKYIDKPKPVPSTPTVEQQEEQEVEQLKQPDL